MSKHITYRFSVTATLPLTDDPHHPDFYTEAQATDPEFQRKIEQRMMAATSLCEAECRVELLDYTVEDDDPHGAECACEMCQMERAQSEAEEPRHE